MPVVTMHKWTLVALTALLVDDSVWLTLLIVEVLHAFMAISFPVLNVHWKREIPVMEDLKGDHPWP